MFRRIYAWLFGYRLCEICDDTRGGAIGNGQYVDGVLMCDYCHANHRHFPYFWKNQP